jgi:hypothetical protein
MAMINVKAFNALSQSAWAVLLYIWSFVMTCPKKLFKSFKNEKSKSNHYTFLCRCYTIPLFSGLYNYIVFRLSSYYNGNNGQNGPLFSKNNNHQNNNTGRKSPFGYWKDIETVVAFFGNKTSERKHPTEHYYY